MGNRIEPIVQDLLEIHNVITGKDETVEDILKKRRVYIGPLARVTDSGRAIVPREYEVVDPEDWYSILD